jgi:DNA-binding LytR/AlgR family response regulator
LNIRLKCLLLDDELPGLSYLKLLCEQIHEIEVVGTFNDPELFVKELPRLIFDLCILDIEMPGTSGIEIAKLLKSKPVIFTTAYKDYAIDAFELDAVDYLIKPIRAERLQQAVNRAIQRIFPANQFPRHIKLNTDRGIAMIDADQLTYVRTSETDSRDKTALLVNGTTIQLKNISFDKLISLLPSESFCRINKKELISIATVQYFSNHQITTNIYGNSGKLLTFNLGDTYRFNFLNKVRG